MAISSKFFISTIHKFDGFYDHWTMLMENLLRAKEYWELVKSSVTVAPPNATPEQRKLAEESKLKDLKDMSYLFQEIDRTILETIMNRDITKDIWESMRRKYQGSTKVKIPQLQALCREVEILCMKDDETIDEYLARNLAIANKMEQTTIVEKMLRTMTIKINYVVCSIEESNDVTTLSIDELQSSLLVYKQRMKINQEKEDEQVLNIASYGRGGFRGCGRGRLGKDQIQCSNI